MKGEITKAKAARILEVTPRSIDRYLARFRQEGPQGLYDGRHSNYHKIEGKTERQIVLTKVEGPHRSSRWIRDRLDLAVHEDSVRRVLLKHHLERTSLPPIKLIQRFEANEPNDLWQRPAAGSFTRSKSTSSWCYTKPSPIGDYPRPSCPIGAASSRPPSCMGRRNISSRKPVSLPPAGLCDGEPSPHYLRDPQLGLDQVVQLDQDCPADRYVRSLRRPASEDLDLLLIHEEPRKVMRTGCISYYGQSYRVPDRYIGKRVWTILKGETLHIECDREAIARYPIQTDYLKNPS